MKRLGLSLFLLVSGACTHTETKPAVEDEFLKLEEATGGRLGVAAVNVRTGKRVQHRPEELFPFCSTFKTMAVAAVLKASETNAGLLSKKLVFTQAELDKAGYSPITAKQVAQGMSVSELAAATVQYSDNAAVNLLMKEIGGLSVVNQFAREIGDETFRLDRWEPDLNAAVPGDPRDTTTPKAMEQSLRRLFLEDMLAPRQRKLLVDWHKGNTTGDRRIRASIPKGWAVGDKTGTCAYGSTNDIGVVWKPNGDAIVLVIYFTHKNEVAKNDDAAVARAAKLIVDRLQ